MRLTDVIEELIEEKGIERSILNSVICEGILAAYKKKYPNLELLVETDKKTGQIKVTIEKEIVSLVQDEISQISLKKCSYLFNCWCYFIPKSIKQIRTILLPNTK